MLQFVSSIILARLLTPEDYGITAMLAIFISVSTILIDSGFGGSLVYHKDVDGRDFSTVFWLNIAISTGIYTCMFLFSNKLASFYGIQELSLYIRILGIVLVFNSLGHIQFSLLYKNLEFNKLNIVNLVSYSIASVIAIFLAYWGLGVWALISQQVLNSVLSTLFLVFFNKYIPQVYFSWEIVKKHWNFGSGLFFSSILRAIYDNMYLQMIGKFSDVKSAGLFNQATKLKDIPSNLFSSTFDTSLFPLFSKLHEDDLFTEKFRIVTRFLAFVCCPILFLMSISARSIVEILLGEKWLDSASLLSFLSIGAIFYIMEIVNRSGLKARGRSMLIFKMDVIKRFISILLMFIFLKTLGVYGLAISYIINSFFCWIINSICLARYCSYSFKCQLLDIVKPFSVSVIIALVVYFISFEIYMSCIGTLLFNTIAFIIIYLSVLIIIKDSSASLFVNLVKSRININRFRSK